MQKTTIKDAGIKYSLMAKIKAHALGSLYRMNARTADCYAFDVDSDGRDWEGGWDWSERLVDKNATFILMLETGELYKNNK